jgi:hypothetical protein
MKDPWERVVEVSVSLRRDDERTAMEGARQ